MLEYLTENAVDRSLFLCGGVLSVQWIFFGNDRCKKRMQKMVDLMTKLVYGIE